MCQNLTTINYCLLPLNSFENIFPQEWIIFWTIHRGVFFFATLRHLWEKQSEPRSRLLRINIINDEIPGDTINSEISLTICSTLRGRSSIAPGTCQPTSQISRRDHILKLQLLGWLALVVPFVSLSKSTLLFSSLDRTATALPILGQRQQHVWSRRSKSITSDFRT